MHIGAVMTFVPTPGRRVPSLAQVRAMLGERLGVLPRYSRKLSQPHTGGLRWPGWVEDPRFDIAEHVHEAALPAPAGRAELLRFAADYWSTRLDRGRPLWDAVLLRGLEGGRWALVTKTHHALVDGIGSVDVGHLMLDSSPRPRRRPPAATPAPEPAGAGAGDLLSWLPEPMKKALRSGFDTALHPGKLSEALRRSAALVDLIVRDELIAAPRTSLNSPIGTRRRFEVVAADLDELKRVKNALGGTVNDVILASATGGLRRVLLARGEEPPSQGLRAMVPVNLRTAAEQLGLGNRITSLFVELPVSEPDPGLRYRHAMWNAESLKSSSQALAGSTLIKLASLAPPALHSFIARSLFASRLFNVTITNVPGPRHPLYAFGARLEDIYPLVPLAAEHAVGIAVVSYAGRVFFGLQGDERAAADLELLRDGIAESLAELRALPAQRRAGRRARPRDPSAGRGRPPTGDRRRALARKRGLRRAVAATLKHVRVPPLTPDRFKEVLTPDQAAELGHTIARARSTLNGRVVWNVNSTMRGGGVAEMLASLIAYSRGAGIDARWSVIRGEERFFAVTKRLHNRLHGELGDGGPLGEAEQRLYVELCEARAAELAELVRPEDIVILHDPQTAGMVPQLKRAAAAVVWRSHIGADLANDLARDAWRFLLAYVEPADAYVFSREAFAWSGLQHAKIAVIPPSIDAFSPKNQPMDDATVAAVLRCGGIEAGPCSRRPRFTRLDGTPARVDTRAEIVGGPLPSGAPLLLQVSRWDRLKDHEGVLRAFCERIAPRIEGDLVLAGPDVHAVADDPEGEQILGEVVAAREEYPAQIRDRVHLVSLPMDDPEENAAFVNALQRRASVIAQKSLREGFGLTVTEAMWKGKAVVAGRVGGIQNQIEDGDSGVLVDPTDLDAFAEAVIDLLQHPGEATAIGERARDRVRAAFLGPRQLGQYVELFERLLMPSSSAAA